RERWGRFLLTTGDRDGAAEQFRLILEHENDRRFVSFAQTHGDLAQLALLRGDVPKALAESQRAVDIFEHVTGRRDVRSGPQLWLVRAAVLRASGDARGARDLAQRALDASQRYDDADAPSIADAEVELANCALALGDAAAARQLADRAGALQQAHPA